MTEREYIHQLRGEIDDSLRSLGGVQISSWQIISVIEAMGKKMFALENAGNTDKKQSELKLWHVGYKRLYGAWKYAVYVAESKAEAERRFNDMVDLTFGRTERFAMLTDIEEIKFYDYRIMIEARP